ncbi:zinc finger domain-containing protein [Rothia mucilaginosa]
MRRPRSAEPCRRCWRYRPDRNIPGQYCPRQHR